MMTKDLLSLALNFPNRSRSYDPRRRCVRFWGHDGAFEICFFVDQGALSAINPDARRDEAGSLSAFDRYRDRILEVAANAYRGHRRESYTLVAADF